MLRFPSRLRDSAWMKRSRLRTSTSTSPALSTRRPCPSISSRSPIHIGDGRGDTLRRAARPARKMALKVYGLERQSSGSHRRRSRRSTATARHSPAYRPGSPCARWRFGIAGQPLARAVIGEHAVDRRKNVVGRAERPIELEPLEAAIGGAHPLTEEWRPTAPKRPGSAPWKQ